MVLRAAEPTRRKTCRKALAELPWPGTRRQTPLTASVPLPTRSPALRSALRPGWWGKPAADAGGTSSPEVWKKRRPPATWPRCSWASAPYADLVAETGSGSARRITAHFPLRPAWEVGFAPRWPSARRSAPGVSNFPGWSGIAAPPPRRYTAPEELRTPRSLREPLSAPPARVGVGAVAQGPRWRQGLFSVRCVPLFRSCRNKHCSFSRGETCTQWWKTAAVPSSHWPGDCGPLWWALDGNALAVGSRYWRLLNYSGCYLVAHWPLVFCMRSVSLSTSLSMCIVKCLWWALWK